MESGVRSGEIDRANCVERGVTTAPASGLSDTHPDRVDVFNQGQRVADLMSEAGPSRLPLGAVNWGGEEWLF